MTARNVCQTKEMEYFFWGKHYFTINAVTLYFHMQNHQKKLRYHKCLLAGKLIGKQSIGLLTFKQNYSSQLYVDNNCCKLYLVSRSVSDPSPVSAMLLGLELLMLPGDRLLAKVSESMLAPRPDGGLRL